jgi:hypothetical protein
LLITGEPPKRAGDPGNRLRTLALAGLNLTSFKETGLFRVSLGKMLGDKDPEKSKRVMEAMLQMDKIDIKRLPEACEGK